MNMAITWNKHEQIQIVRNGKFSNGADTLLKRKVFVAMSGGVDSSVAAALLKQQGYDVIGVFFKPWQPKSGPAFCNWQKDRQDALAVATKLDIPFKTWDFSKEYGKAVTQYMIKSYKKGMTPNPDVMCNKEIKFGIFLKKALAEGSDFIATGHYARVRHAKSGSSLLKAKDKKKDQTYFLYTLTQKELRHCLFPIGDYLKPDIRTIAKKFGLITYDKKDSQGVCFVGDLDMKDFLKRYIKPRSGWIKLFNTDQILGEHDGVDYYTIGQRHGFDLKNGGGPYYVVKKDHAKNILYVTTNSKDLDGKDIRVTDLTWIEKNRPDTFMAKIRYRTEEVPAVLTGKNITFTKPVRAATAGQSVVFYKGQIVLGGAVIR